MKKSVFVMALLAAPASQAGSWDYEPWRSVGDGSNGATPQAGASLSTDQAGVQFAISLESVDEQPPVWMVTVSAADRIVGLSSIRALNPDRVQDEQVNILSARQSQPLAGKSGRPGLSAAITPDGMISIKHSARVELEAEINGAANITYTIDTSDLGLAFVEFDMDARRLSGVDAGRAYLLEYDRRHNPLNSIPKDLWMIAPDEVEKHRVQLGLTRERILAMSQYDIEDALFDQADQAFKERQAAGAARDAAAREAGEELYRTLAAFEFFEPRDCVAPDIPQAITTQQQAEAFNAAVTSYQNCLKGNQERDAGAYSAVIGVLGYQMTPGTFAVSEPDDQAFSGAVLLACEGLAPEAGQCSSAIGAIAQTFGERMQGVNRQYARFQENARHLYGQ